MASIQTQVELWQQAISVSGYPVPDQGQAHAQEYLLQLIEVAVAGAGQPLPPAGLSWNDRYLALLRSLTNTVVDPTMSYNDEVTALLQGIAVNGVGGGSLTKILDLDFASGDTDHNFKVDGTTLSDVYGSGADIFAANTGVGGTMALAAESSEGAGDGTLTLQQSSTVSDFFNTSTSAARLEIRGLRSNLGVNPGDKLLVEMTGSLPALAASGSNPSWNVFLRSSTGLDSRETWRFARGTGGWNIALYGQPGSTRTGSASTDAPSSPIVIPFVVPFPQLIMGGTVEDSDVTPGSAGDWTQDLTPTDIHIGMAIRRTGATLAQATLTLTRFRVYVDRRGLVA